MTPPRLTPAAARTLAARLDEIERRLEVLEAAVAVDAVIREAFMRLEEER